MQELRLLPSPLDALIDALGGAQEVAEMTGRRGRLVRSSRTGGRLKYELRAEHEETRCVLRVSHSKTCVKPSLRYQFAKLWVMISIASTISNRSSQLHKVARVKE